MDIYSFPPLPPNFDTIGKFYVTFAAVWTTLLLAGMAFLVANRRKPLLKIRGLFLSLPAILMLHAYWIMAQVVYPLSQAIPALLAYDVQYFFMGIWFPLGIALFQASNMRFLYIAELQKQFTHSRYQKNHGCNGSATSWLCRLRNMDYTKRLMVYIGIGMVFQILLTVGMWLACKKYHPSFGIPGTELHGDLMQQLIELGRGWEWWPSVLWYSIWTWVVAPILIYRAWGIRDTLGWRLQTVGCCLASLHAVPLWLAATYHPAFAPVNKYFAPSEWIHLSSMFFEIFTVFIPCFLVVKQKIRSKEAVDSNAKWENSSDTTLGPSSSMEWTSSSRLEKGYATDSIMDESTDCLLTMKALDRVLSNNPMPLQEFSALRDFSGENVAYLTRVAQWNAAWPNNPTEDEIRDQFTQALGIYTDLVSPRDAEFPINLSSQELRDLEDIFEKPARIICGEARVNVAVPFGAGGLITRPSHDTTSAASAGSRIEFEDIVDRIRYMGAISDNFGSAVFDASYKSVKYLVFTNTWPKFIDEAHRRRSIDSERSDDTAATDTTFVTRVASKVKSFL